MGSFMGFGVRGLVWSMGLSPSICSDGGRGKRGALQVFDGAPERLGSTALCQSVETHAPGCNTVAVATAKKGERGAMPG